MRGGMGALLGALTLVVVVAGVASAAGAPVVSAGLDQDVLLGDTVYLDGSPTHVPDGELDGLEWSIEAPNGSEMTPECVDCEVTSFTPSQTGQYNVTLTARSESGVERSDTLYVTVGDYDPVVSPESTSGSGDGGGPVRTTTTVNCLGGVNYSQAQNRGVCQGGGHTVTTVQVGGEVQSYIVRSSGLASKYPSERIGNNKWRISPEAVAEGPQDGEDQSQEGSTNSRDKDSGADSGSGSSGDSYSGDCQNVPSSWCSA